MLIRIIIFLLINFAALGLGSLFTSNGVSSDWYYSLNKAPWTPPGWVFGAAWTTIMVCFSIYLAFAWEIIENKTWLISIFSIQWILNVGWNPLFFKYQEVLPALVVIILLTIVVGYILFGNWSQMRIKSLLILPYFVWLLIATSLNMYILVNN